MSREEKARKLRLNLTKIAAGDSTLSVNDLRVELALERIVARLSTDPKLKNHLIYKGGFVLLKMLEHQRFTRDLDALADNVEKDIVEKLVRSAISKDLDDGLWFGDINTVSLDEQGEYGAIRFDCAFQIGDPPVKDNATKKLSRIHFDVGFGDSVKSNLKFVPMPSLLKSDEIITWKVYPSEFILSEKLQTLVNRKSANSRGKDVYDLVVLFGECKNQKLIENAIISTFERRETPIPASFTDFASNLDLRVLKGSWGAVQQIGESVSFEECWSNLMEQMSELDRKIKQNFSLI